MGAVVPADLYFTGADDLVAAIAARWGVPVERVGHFIVIAQVADPADGCDVLCCCEYTTSEAPAILAGMAASMDDRARRLQS
jgi:hypothetical protein